MGSGVGFDHVMDVGCARAARSPVGKSTSDLDGVLAASGRECWMRGGGRCGVGERGLPRTPY